MEVGDFLKNIYDNVYVDISLNKKNLQINDEVDLKIKIVNKSNYDLENAFIKILVDKSLFKILDTRYSECINDFSNIGNIEKDSTVDLSIRVRLESLSTTMYSKISTNLNFHIVYDDEPNDFTICSDDFTISFGEEKEIISISSDSLELIYNVDRSEVLEGDFIEHTLNIKNVSNSEIENLHIKDIFEEDFYFINDSIIVDKIPRINEDLEYFLVGDLDVSESVEVKFRTKAINDINNISFLVEYDSLGGRFTKESNKLDIKILSAGFSQTTFIKTQDKENLNINEIVEFKLEFINVGNTVARNVLIKDDIVDELIFLKGSLYVNNKSFDCDIFEDGIMFEKIEPLQKVNIKYKAKAYDLSQDIKKPAKLYYNNKIINSSTTDLSISGVKINILKDLSSTNVHIGDILSCRILLENKGNIDIESLKVIDNVNSSFEFIRESLKINNSTLYDAETINNLTIKNLKSGERLNITYQLKVIDLPRPNPVVDKTIVRFCYLDFDNIKTCSISSQKNKIYINNPNLFVKDTSSFLVDKMSTKICKNEDLAYFKFNIENKGNVSLYDVCMKLNLEDELKLDMDSIKINNKKYVLDENNIYIGDLKISDSYNIEFFAKVDYIDRYTFESIFYFEYEFEDLKREEEFREVKKYLEMIEIIEPKIEIIKTLNDDLVEIGEEIVQNIEIMNTGNIDFYGVIIDLNESEFLSKLEYTALFNGNYVNKDKKLLLERLRVGENIKINIKYNLPKNSKCEEFIDESFISASYDIYDRQKLKINAESNKLKINIRNASLSIIPKCSSKNVVLKEKYTYIFSVVNNGNCDFDEVKLNFEVPDFIKYVKDSLYLNNKKIECSKLKNINLGSFQKNQSSNITFEFYVERLPKKRHFSIDLDAVATYKNCERSINRSFESEKYEIKIENVELQIAKFISHDYLQKGDVITIQNILNNTGSIDLKNVFLVDNENQNLDFIEGSVFVDGENEDKLNPVNGINLDLEVSKNVLVTYDYEYNPKSYSSRVIHYSDLEYSYSIDDKIKSKNLKSEVIRIDGGLSTFKQFNVDNRYTLYEYEPDLYEIISAQTDGFIESVHEAKSAENLTGKKVIIKGSLIDRVEYLIKSDKASLYLLERTHPFTTFINIPKEYYSEDIDFKIKADDVFYRLNNKRSLFISSLISIEGVL
ncbi:MAG: hypothetical protein R3Y64_00190 [Peptostreptococcaceae bacterium]